MVGLGCVFYCNKYSIFIDFFLLYGKIYSVDNLIKIKDYYDRYALPFNYGIR